MIILLLVLIVLMMFRPLRLLIGSLFIGLLVVIMDIAGAHKGSPAAPGTAFILAQIGYWALIALAAHSRRAARRRDIERAVRRPADSGARKAG